MVSATLFITEIKLPLPSEDTERPVTNCVWFLPFARVCSQVTMQAKCKEPSYFHRLSPFLSSYVFRQCSVMLELYIFFLSLRLTMASTGRVARAFCDQFYDSGVQLAKGF